MAKKKWLMDPIERESGLYADISGRILGYAKMRLDVKKSASCM